MRLALTALLLGSTLCSSRAHASDFTTPSGFNFESVSAGGPVAAVLDDGTMLLSTGAFGADELSVLHGDGSLTLFADGFGSLAGIAQSPVSGDIIVGDSLGANALTILRDLNLDGDALDAGEHTTHPAILPLLSNGEAPLPFDVAFEPGTDVFYVSGSTPFGPGLEGAVLRVDGAGATLWAEDLELASGLAWGDGQLYVADLAADFSAARVVALLDDNTDGDALDAGEAIDFATGLSGAFDLVRAKDGSLYVSGLLDFADFSSPVGRLLPDGNGDGHTDGVDELSIDGFAFSSTLVLVEGDRGFEAGAAGDGELFIGDFTLPDGFRRVRSAPHASTVVTGDVASNSSFDVTVSGAPGAGALFVISLDQSTNSIADIGDICLGFDGPYLLFPPLFTGPGGSAEFEVVFGDVPGLVGLPITIQGFTLEGGDVGIGDGFDFIIAP